MPLWVQGGSYKEPRLKVHSSARMGATGQSKKGYGSVKIRLNKYQLQDNV